MHFTREPILESIISARDGYKISIKRSSVLPNDVNPPEEYIVDSVEVVSFRDSLFFRSLEKPKPFLLPVSQYELLEVKETRIVLKSATHERSIKIGGGKEQQQQPKAAREREPNVETIVEEIEEEIGISGEEGAPKAENVQHSVQQEPTRGDRKRDRRKRRRGRDDRDWQDRSQQGASSASSQEERGSAATTSGEETVGEPSTLPPVIPFATLIPPPTTLISETLSRYKDVMFGEIHTKKGVQEAPKEDTFIEIKEVIYEDKKPEADENNASDEPLTRLRLDENYFDKGGFGPQY